MAILAGNWKLYKTRKDVEAFFDSLADIDPAGHECYVAPSPSLLETACRKSLEKGSKINILSQNIAYKLEGALNGRDKCKATS
jgi:triosephosphate isomerase